MKTKNQIYDQAINDAQQEIGDIYTEIYKKKPVHATKNLSSTFVIIRRRIDALYKEKKHAR